MEYKVTGKTLRCPHCNSTDFLKRQAQLNTAVLTLFDLDFLNKSATTYLCKSCGRIEWFYTQAVQQRDSRDTESLFFGDEDEVLDDKTQCLVCGGTMQEEQNSCSQCGWTYSEKDNVGS